MAMPVFESEYEWEQPEFESHLESGRDGEFEVNPMRKVYPDAMDAMTEHLAHVAAEAESEQQAAEGFLPLIPLVASKLLPLAAKMLPKAAKALPRIANVVQRVTPQLTRGVSHLTRTLFRNPRTRPLLRTMPSIARRAVGSIVRQVAAGHPITPQTARRTLVRQARHVLSRPQQVAQVIRRSRTWDRHAHRIAGTGVPPAPCGCGCSCRMAVRREPVCCRCCGQLIRVR
jgi:hypothetical protein